MKLYRVVQGEKILQLLTVMAKSTFHSHLLLVALNSMEIPQLFVGLIKKSIKQL